MNVPPELVVWMLAAIAAFISFAVHLLIRINGNVARICTNHEVQQERTAAKIAALERHQARNEQETAQLRKHLGYPQPNAHHP